MRGPAECAVRNVSSILINMVKQYIEENRERFLEELFELLRIPSVSAQSVHKGDMVLSLIHI